MSKSGAMGSKAARGREAGMAGDRVFVQCEV